MQHSDWWITLYEYIKYNIFDHVMSRPDGSLSNEKCTSLFPEVLGNVVITGCLNQFWFRTEQHSRHFWTLRTSEYRAGRYLSITREECSMMQLITRWRSPNSCSIKWFRVWMEKVPFQIFPLAAWNAARTRGLAPWLAPFHPSRGGGDGNPTPLGDQFRTEQKNSRMEDTDA